MTPDDIRQWLAPRAADAHKGDNGHVLIVAGSPGMTGAAVLAALGALRSGAGLVTVAAPAPVRAVIHGALWEAMTIDRAEISSYLERRKITTLAIGPGLGVGPVQKALVKKLLKLKLPTVLDADGLNNLTLSELPQHSPHLIITPHEGELARLRRQTRAAVHARRAAAAQETARAFGGICVLKGHRTVCATASEVRTNPTGNSAMATGGMGDVLTGIIAGLLAQKAPPWAAASAGVYLHGFAGDLAALADRGLLAHEVADALPRALAQILRTPR